jgi:plasmid stabilization system protein ParE
VARVIVSPRALTDLERLVAGLGLAAAAMARVQRSLRMLEQFPNAGRALTGRWGGMRFIIGPWPWMILVYAYDADDDAVFVVAVQDGRSSSSATGSSSATTSGPRRRTGRRPVR